MSEFVNHLAFGSASFAFLAETVVRAFLLYLLLKLAIRLMGSRLVTQMTSADMATFATIGAAIGAPMHSGDVGITSSVLVLGVAIGVYRASAALRRSRHAERLLHEKPLILLKDGHIVGEAMAEARLSRDHFFSMLRSRGVEHLGQVQRVYLEATGAIAVFFAAKPVAGLSILPDEDLDVRRLQPVGQGFVTCIGCGHLTHGEPPGCPYCGQTRWLPAVQALTARGPQGSTDASSSNSQPEEKVIAADDTSANP